MRKTTAMVALLALLAFAGCGGDDAEEAARDASTAVTDVDTNEVRDTVEAALDTAEAALDEALTRDLAEQHGSGLGGTVKLEPISQDRVKVTVELEGAEAGAAYPAHVHAGTCDDLDPEPEYPLDDVVDGHSQTTIDASPLELLTGEFAVNVHDADDPNLYVACADIATP